MKVHNEDKSLKAIVIGASSDIGNALCEDWILKGWEVAGTYRTNSPIIDNLRKKNIALIECDLENTISIDKSCTYLNEKITSWDVLVLSPGLLEPVDFFCKSNFEEWENSVKINFTSQLRFVHRLLPNRSPAGFLGPNVLFFAGGGTNSAPVNYSAYTVSKIALIKMVELLASELPDVKFLIVGPGWVKTKIHHSILNTCDLNSESYKRTALMFENGEFTPMDKVVKCCNTLISGSREILTGRNYSVVHDKWDDPRLIEQLEKNPDAYKLRRYGN